MFKKVRGLLFILSILTMFAVVDFGFSKFLSVKATDEPPSGESTPGYVQKQTWVNSFSDEDKFKVLGDIAPGSAILMQDLQRRIDALYIAARAGNWPLAQYFIDYARKTIDINKTTRPKRKDALESHVTNSIGTKDEPLDGTLQAAINAKSWKDFNRAFKNTVTSCNACHVASDHAEIIYKIPARAEINLQYLPPMGVQ